MTWERILEQTFWIGLLAATLRQAIPILYAALGELITERSGVLNIGIEGNMLVGALAGFAGAYYTGTPWGGVACALVAGLLMGLLMAFGSVTLRADQIASGIAINIFALGITGFFFRYLFGDLFLPPSIKGFAGVDIPLLSDIPFLGPILFQQVILVYLGIFLVPLVWLFVYRTNFGLNIRVVGDMPEAGDSVGIRVALTRYVCTGIGGMFSALGGAMLSLGHMNMFVEEMTAGRGFIALTAVIFGKWSPGRTLAATLLFGFADALQLRFQALGFGIPFQFLLMTPYVLTILVLVFAIGRADAPAALGVPYWRKGS